MESRVLFSQRGLLSWVWKLFTESESSSNTKIWKKTTVVHITLNGKSQAINPSSLTKEVLQQLSANSKTFPKEILDQIDIENKEVADLIRQALNDNGQMDMNTVSQPNTSQQRPVIRKGPLKMVSCPKCKHEIAEAEWCWYCGHVFETTKETTQQVNEVDEKFLNKEVKPDQESKQQKEQKIQDSFKDRMEGL
jgi:hypothetical protein